CRDACVQLRRHTRPLPLHRLGQRLSFPPGQGGLLLMRAEYDLSAAQPAHAAGSVVAASLTEKAFEGVPGWHEMIVRPATGVTLVESSVPQTDVTNELTAYPPQMLTAPLSVREA